MNFLKKYPVAWAITIVVILASSFFGVAMADADLLPVQPSETVYDGANVLSNQTEETVQRFNMELDESYAAYVAVATVQNLKGWDPDNYAEALFNEWELYGNDFLLLLDIGGNECYLFYGSYHNGFDYEAYLDSYVGPAFDRGDYDSAVTSLLPAVEQYLAQGSTVPDDGYYDDGYVSGPQYVGYDGPYYGASNLMLIIFLIVVVIAVLNSVERNRYRTWYGQYGHMATPPVMWRPIFFWHRPGSAWCRRMHHRPSPPPNHFGGGPRPGGGGFHSGPRPGGGFNSRPGGGFGSRPSGGFGGGGSRSSRPSSRPSGGFGGGSRGGRSGGGFGGGGGRRGGGGFGGGGRGGRR